MNISRRWFIGGAASFGALGTFGGSRILDGRGFRASGEPKLRFGVVSDIHVSYVGEGEDPAKHGNNQMFRRTLEWFRDQKVDAVVIAGDMADHGIVEELEAVAEGQFSRLGDFLRDRKAAIEPGLPFFYVQHPHLKDTCYGPWAWGHDRGDATKTLSAFPNAIAFSGHSHYSLTDELPGTEVRFTVIPRNCFGKAGSPVRSDRINAMRRP